MNDRNSYWTRYWNRRRFLQGTAIASMGGAAWLAGACGDDDDDEDGGNGTPGTGGGADVPDGHQTLGTTTEELRQQFHWSKLKNVPGQGDPKAGGRVVDRE